MRFAAKAPFLAFAFCFAFFLDASPAVLSERIFLTVGFFFEARPPAASPQCLSVALSSAAFLAARVSA